MSRSESTTHGENVRTGVKDLSTDAKYVASEAKAAAADAYTSAKDVAAERVGQLREHAAQYYEQGKEKLGDYEGQIEDYIKNQPVKSMLIAAGVGVVLGILLKRR